MIRTHLYAMLFGAILCTIPAMKLAGWYGDIRVDRAVKAANELCEKNAKLTDGVTDALNKKLATANARHADAIGRLYDAAHRPPVSAIGNDGASYDNGLYYADRRAATAALDRAFIASKQAEQLTACQSFVKQERE